MHRLWSSIDRPAAEGSPEATLPGEGYIRGFDGMRALAVMMVIQGHLGFTQGTFEPFSGMNDGVAIFFVMSGFLITGLLLREQDKGGIQVLRFYGRRILRLYPALLLYVAGVAIADWLDIATVKPVAYVASLTYLMNYISPANHSRELSHLWSLAVEEQFYLTWPLVMKYARRIVMPLAVVALIASFWLRVHPLDPTNRLIPRWFLPAADSILLGSVAALIVVPRYRSTAWMRRLLSSPECLMLAVVAYTAFKWSVIPGIGVGNSAFVLLYIQHAGVVLGLIWICTNQQSLLVRTLELAPIAYLGRISYGIYLWQGLFVRNGPADPRSWVHEFPVNVVLSVAVAALSYSLVERRFLSIKRYFKPRDRRVHNSEALSGR